MSENTITYDVNELTNRYASVGESALEYDAAGNLTKDRLGYGYSYDYENRIAEINDVNGTVVAEFAYDALGRRIRKIDSNTGETTLYYYNDNWQVLCEYDGGGSIERVYMYGNYIDEPIMTYSGGIYFYVQDHLYSTAALVDPSGNVAERYEYDAYGQVHVLDANFADDADGVSDCANPYMFQGKRLDLLDNGGLELMSWPYRDYSMYLGRWYQREKLGMIPNDDEEINPFFPQRQYEDGLSYYEFAGSAPVVNLDVKGLWSAGSQFCCKIEEAHTITYYPSPGGAGFPGPVYPITSCYTTCTQETIHSTCDNPRAACCSHYQGLSSIQVYAAEHGSCCWCVARLMVKLTGGVPLVPHFWVIVTCDAGGPSFGAESNPLNDGEITFSVGDDTSMFGHTMWKSRISCEQAAMWKMVLESTSWDYSLFGSNCWQFASALYLEMSSGCP